MFEINFYQGELKVLNQIIDKGETYLWDYPGMAQETGGRIVNLAGPEGLPTLFSDEAFRQYCWQGSESDTPPFSKSDTPPFSTKSEDHSQLYEGSYPVSKVILSGPFTECVRGPFRQKCYSKTSMNSRSTVCQGAEAAKQVLLADDAASVGRNEGERFTGPMGNFGCTLKGMRNRRSLMIDGSKSQQGGNLDECMKYWLNSKEGLGRPLGGLIFAERTLAAAQEVHDAYKQINEIAKTITELWVKAWNLSNWVSMKLAEKGTYVPNENNCRLGFPGTNFNFPLPTKYTYRAKKFVTTRTKPCIQLEKANMILFQAEHYKMEWPAFQAGGTMKRKIIPPGEQPVDKLVEAYCHSINNMRSLNCESCVGEGDEKKECALNGKVCNLPGVSNEDQDRLKTSVHETNLFTMQEVMLKCEEHWQKEFGKVRYHLDVVFNVADQAIQFVQPYPSHSIRGFTHGTLTTAQGRITSVAQGINDYWKSATKYFHNKYSLCLKKEDTSKDGYHNMVGYSYSVRQELDGFNPYPCGRKDGWGKQSSKKDVEESMKLLFPEPGVGGMLDDLSPRAYKAANYGLSDYTFSAESIPSQNLAREYFTDLVLSGFCKMEVLTTLWEDFEGKPTRTPSFRSFLTSVKGYNEYATSWKLLITTAVEVCFDYWKERIDKFVKFSGCNGEWPAASECPVLLMGSGEKPDDFWPGLTPLPSQLPNIPVVSFVLRCFPVIWLDLKILIFYKQSCIMMILVTIRLNLETPYTGYKLKW